MADQSEFNNHFTPTCLHLAVQEVEIFAFLKKTEKVESRRTHFQFSIEMQNFLLPAQQNLDEFEKNGCQSRI